MAINLKAIIAQLEACNYKCEAGPLENNVEFMKLKMAAAHSTHWEPTEIVELDEDALYKHVESRLIEMGRTPDRQQIELILDLHYEYLHEIGIVDEIEEDD